FEQIRRDYEFGGVKIRELARKFGVHRRDIRQAISSALPPARKRPARHSPKLQPVRAFIDAILESDHKAPRKQRHTARRIYIRIGQELPAAAIAERTVRRYVRERKYHLGLSTAEVFIPQSYLPGHEAQVDWYEATVLLSDESRTAHFFSMRSMSSGAAFHRAYPRATQQAFLEAHEEAFDYFGGVFRTLRFDNLGSAVKKILRGHTRQETERFIAFRSHWRFAAEFCNPACGNEKGGVEGEVGYFRRNHLVPIPQAADFADLNRQLIDACHADHARQIGDRQQSVGQMMEAERASLLPFPDERFEIAEVSFPIVDGKGCVKVRNNSYSTPLRARTKVRANILPAYVEVWHDARMVARHERCYGNGQQVLSLDHYLEVLERKPGAFAGSIPLQQWRKQGRWSQEFDLLWQSLQQRHGKEAGTKQMIELLVLGREHGFAKLAQVVTSALEMGCTDAAAVRYLLTAEHLAHVHTEALSLSSLSHYERPLPVMSDYDQLLGMEVS
ncbi:MAG: IS21 family transposase, partial [Acidobacteria bacterium]|nr:IS21 family transposase [Acidobacteriota bacterium]